MYSRIASVVIVTITLVVFDMGPTYGQTNTKKGKAPPSSKAAPTQEKETLPPVPVEPPPPPPFAPIVWKENIPPVDYVRNEPTKVFEWVESQLKSVAGKPDKFSTTDEKRQYEIALSEKMSAIGLLPFVTSQTRCSRTYDADKQLFNIKPSAFSFNDPLLREPNPEQLKLRKLIIVRDSIKKDTYTGQNAYGATTEINREAFNEFALAYPAGATTEPGAIVVPGGSASSVSLPYRYTFIHYSTTLPMIPAEARETDKDIVCLWVIKLEPPYVFKYTERTLPTRDMPFDRTTNGVALYGALDQFWLFNKVTGAVYSKNTRRTQ